MRAWGIAPAVLELFGPYEFLKEQGWWFGRDKENRKGYGHKLEDCVEIGKPSYIDLSRGGRSGLELLNAESELLLLTYALCIVVFAVVGFVSRP